FASDAYNLVSGDANEASDVFVVETLPGAPAQPSAISARPPALRTQAIWRLSARAISLPDGSVRVVAVLPGAGTVRAKADAQLGPQARTQPVAPARRRARSESVLRLRLRLPDRLRRLARAAGGLYATVRVGFSGPGGKPLQAELGTRFRVYRPS